MSMLIIAWAVGLVMDPTGDQLNIFYWKTGNLFADFFDIIICTADRDPFFNNPSSLPEWYGGYLPLSHLLLYPFACLDSYSSMTLVDAWNSKIGIMSVLLFIIGSLAFFYFALYKLGKSKKKTGLILVLLFCSYVNLFAIERGNFVILSAACVTTFLLLYDSPKKEYHWLALLCISIAATLKIYPVLFGLVLLIDKKYKSIAICIIMGLVLTFAPYLFFQHGFGNISRHIEMLRMGVQEAWPVTLITPRYGLQHIVYVAITSLPGIPTNGLVTISRYLLILVSVFSIVLCFFTKNRWIQIALLSIVVIQFPFDSAFYTGLYFFPLIIMFFNKQFYTKKDIIYVLLFCVFLNPFQIVYNDWLLVNYILANIALLTIWGLLLFDVIKEVKPKVYLSKILNK
jgi:hypothetical protein